MEGSKRGGGYGHGREEMDFGGLAGRGVTGLSDQSWGLNKREGQFLVLDVG